MSDLLREWRAGGTCNICGGKTFGPGPLGRMSSNDRLPGCLTCISLERHRALRVIFESLPLGLFYRARVLQFSHDVALEPRWFHSFERSIYGKENSIDLQNAIDRPDDSYDLISMNHVMEFVLDARAAFHEFSRILALDGIIQIGFSRATSRPNCVHFDEPRGHEGLRHLFGEDLPRYLGLQDLGMECCVVDGRDPVTGVVENFHFFTRRPDVMRLLSEFPRL